jgi:diguanylate cyclase (GGDEF)-like protein
MDEDEAGRLDRDQTLADRDQTLADTDQTLADSDQTSADSDQHAADEDQAASDRDLAAGVDPAAHAFSRAVRRRSTRLREHAAHERLTAAEQRDATAQQRDDAAAARDQAADARSQMSIELEAAHARADGGDDGPAGSAEIAQRAAAMRQRAAEQRTHAAEQRALAAADREAAARDRERAAHDRLRALVDREALAREVIIAETDPLTGARARGAGLEDLKREVERSRRADGQLIVAYIDVVGLKVVNDTHGHDAGDELLRGVVTHLREHLRPYDLILRLGGDEFLVVMSNTSLSEARARFEAGAPALAAATNGGEISLGFAELGGEDTVDTLIARADLQLIDARRRNAGRWPRAVDVDGDGDGDEPS